MSLKKTVLITGGEGDLARAINKSFAGAGWNTMSPGKQTLDVTNPDMVKEYFKQISSLDALICNAGIIKDGTNANMSDGAFADVLAVNLRGAFLCAKHASRIMRKTGGCIIFIGSRSAVRGTHGQSNYAAAKAGLIGMCQSLAREFGPYNIRCNVVCPGYIQTKMTNHLRGEKENAIAKQHALGRFNTAEQAADFIVFMGDMENVSGQVFQLDSRIDRWT